MIRIVIKRAFERTRQIADFVPIKAYCEISTDIEITGDVPQEKIDEALDLASKRLACFAESEVEKTLINYQPICIVCKGKGVTVILNKEGVCGNCVKSLHFQAAEFRADAEKMRKEKEPPATGIKGSKNINP